jgi:hypothetical protein
MNGAHDSQPRDTAVSFGSMKWRIVLAAAALPIATNAAAASVKIERNSATLEFTYEWPSEAAAIPALDRRIRTEAEMAYRKHLAMGRDDKKLYQQQQRDGVTDFYSKQWKTMGETSRLLSLQYELGTFTGGAHPNTSYGVLLWDRKLNREIPLNTLFLRADAFSALTRIHYCAALDAERRKRRQGEKLGGDFDQCPKFSDLAISPVDTNKDGRFDTIALGASPYVAGPYVEGEYDISLPVTSQLIAAIKPEFRNSFARQRQ